jgi:predicted acetyltransferase
LAFVFLIGCGKGSSTPGLSAGSYDTSVVPDSGQPAFPKLGQYWVVDSQDACHLRQDSVVLVDQTLEKLRTDHIAEVAIVCQTGVKNQGPLNDEKIWTMKWGNWARIGDLKDQRGVVVLIRPDVKPEDNRITIENSVWLYQNTVLTYRPVIEEAARYANAGDYSGCIESLARNLDETLRQVVKPGQN